jgi:hypothetical protein
MQHTDKAIAEFEAWWDRQPHREQFEDVKDQMRNVAVAFYQKGREDVVVELPQPFSAAACRVSLALRDKNEMLRECRAAIEAAGAKWRE